MIKNIIFDIGGIILDDSIDNLSRVFNKDMTDIYKKVYMGDFKKCLLGELSFLDYSKQFEKDVDYKYIKDILDPNKLNIITPVINENLSYIIKLKERGYHLYLLSNLAKETYDYLNSLININNYFDGAVFSFEEQMKKPDEAIFKLIINKYNLNKDETIYFDDKEKMVNVASSLGIRSYVFKSIEDIEKNI